MTSVKMQLVFLLQQFEHGREVLGYQQRLSQIGSNWQDIARKLAKTFLHKLVWNHGQVNDKWEKLEKKYIVKKKEERITRSTPSKCCQFESTKDVNHHIKLECEKLSSQGDTSFPICTILVFLDGAQTNASLVTLCMHACYQ